MKLSEFKRSGNGTGRTAASGGAWLLATAADRSDGDRRFADTEPGRARRPSRPAAFPAAEPGGIHPGGPVEVTVPGPRQRPGQPRQPSPVSHRCSLTAPIASHTSSAASNPRHKDPSPTTPPANGSQATASSPGPVALMISGHPRAYPARSPAVATALTPERTRPITAPAQSAGRSTVTGPATATQRRCGPASPPWHRRRPATGPCRRPVTACAAAGPTPRGPAAGTATCAPRT